MFNLNAIVITDKITTTDEFLAAVRSASGNYRLANDLDFSSLAGLNQELYDAGKQISKVANYDSASVFNGTIDGNGYAVKNLFIYSNVDKTNAGLIYKLGENGVIKNISFEGLIIGANGKLIVEVAGKLENVNIVVSMMGSNGWKAAGNAMWTGTNILDNIDNGKATLKNVVIDVSAIAEEADAFGSSKQYSLIRFANNTVPNVTNVVFKGVGDRWKNNVVRAASGSFGEGENDANGVSGATLGIYADYLDGTNNGATYPTKGWNVKFWTMQDGKAVWKTKAEN